MPSYLAVDLETLLRHLAWQGKDQAFLRNLDDEELANLKNPTGAPLSKNQVIGLRVHLHDVGAGVAAEIAPGVHCAALTSVVFQSDYFLILLESFIIVCIFPS